MKRILYAASIVLIVFLIVYLGFKLGYKGTPVSPNGNTTSTSGQVSMGNFPSDQGAPIGSQSTSTSEEPTSVQDILSDEVVFGKAIDRKISSYQVTPSS